MHKKLFAAGLAALMIVSMLACFVLPSTAARLEDNQHYYVRTAADWNKTLKEITGDWSGKTLHIERDIDFSEEAFSKIETFAGTLDGHGHKFTNISLTSNDINGASLIKTLKGTIKNLTLDSSCTFKNTYSYGAKTGAFAAISQGGTIYNCTSSATVTATKGDHLGGFVGTATSGVTIDGCFFNGTVTSTNAAGTAAAFIGYKSDASNAKVYNSIAMGTLTANNTGMVRAHSCITQDANSNRYSLFNSYALGGMNAYFYNIDSRYDANVAASLEAAHTMDDAMKAAWTVNNDHIAIGNPQVYFSADRNNNLLSGCLKEERIVKVTTIKDGTSTENYYGPRMVDPQNANAQTTQTQITPEAVSGKDIKVTGAQFENKIIYLDYQDVLVNYVDNTTDDYKFSQAKAQLQELVDAYSAMDSKYFTNWSAKQNWLSGAKYILANATKLSQLQTSINDEANLADGVASLTYPNYPSLKDYNVYKHIASIKDYAVGSAEEWLAAVEMSDFVHNDKAVNFTGITIHLTKNINMGNAAMLPLCYGDICDANINGHDFAFENINIRVGAAFGPVGLIGHLGKTASKYIYNLGISSGTVYTTGFPRYKLYTGSTDAGNKTGGICGRAYRNGSLFRKCWNGANIKSTNPDSTAGIIADARQTVTIDSCFNIGRSSNTGVSGYGQNSEKVYNSFTGAGARAAVNISLNILGTPRLSNVDQICAKFDEHFKNVYSVIRPTLSLTHLSDGTKYPDQLKAEQDAGEQWSARYSVPLSNAEAAWMVMDNYKQQNLGSGEKIYFTLKNGEVAFGKPDGSDQIRRITLKYGDQTRYLYAAAGSTITLTCPDADATDVKTGRENEFYLYNYFKPATKTALSEINGNQLTVGNENLTVLAGKNIRRGDADKSGTINIKDGLVTVQKVANKAVSIDEMAADVNSNGAIEVSDALLMVREWLNGAKGNFFDSTLPTAKRDDYIKVCSYNIKTLHYDPLSTYKDGSDDPYDNGLASERYDDVAAELAKVNADIIGLQEVDVGDSDSNNVDQLAMLASSLKTKLGKTYHTKFMCTVLDTKDGTGGYGHGIMTIYSILDYNEIRFAGMQNADGSRFDAQEPRGFAWYDLDINKNGKYDLGTDIRFYNCHLAEITYEQLDFMADYMEADVGNGHLVVSTGDYNLQAYEMKGAFDTDKLTALNGSDQINSFCYTTDSGNTIDNIIVSDNLDYYWNEGMKIGIFSSNATYDYTINDRGNVIAETTSTSTASDHLAIWTYIKNPAK